ncbi:MAG TPA: hydroxymethylglutaryl-CoA lyase [Caulobacteraceae bacterium]|jgi:hydroxymethylglutaryl-CoA lyase|nr:hydroxymethylglutaryl-CoA lyase [Caulobacteraceae bacterium]
MSEHIEIVEVGPRDGLQNEAVVLSVEDRVAFIEKLAAAGARRIETVSFVNPNRVPQMGNAEAVSAALGKTPGRSCIGVVLNTKGYDRAVEAGVDEANLSVAASEGFARANSGMGVTDQLRMIAGIAERALNSVRAGSCGPKLSATISTAWGCPFDGEVSVGQVAAIVHELAMLKIPKIALADTIGAADPWSVRKTVEAAYKAAPDAVIRLHFHDTRNTGLANAYAGVGAGVRVLDASCGGIGGCPFAPNATGNIATEDLVYMLERGGFETGYDLSGLIDAATWIGEKLGKVPSSKLSKAGSFPNLGVPDRWPRKEKASMLATEVSA